MAWTKTKDWDAIQSGRKKRRFTDAQRAAYWKKKYYALRKQIESFGQRGERWP